MTSMGGKCLRCGYSWLNVPRCSNCGRITRMSAMRRAFRMGRGRK